MGFSGHQLAFWKVSSPLALRQAAQKTGCRSARTHHLAHCPLLNCCSGSRKTSCCGRTEAAEGRACASREHWGPCDSQDTIQGTQIRSGRSRPPAEALEIDRRWQAGGGGVWEKRQHHRFLEKRGRAWFLLLLALISLSFVVILDKDDDGAGASFVPSVIPNIWRTEW